ncbi:MAG: hypothetical protein KKD97_16050 [Gammaproteobacteria bacterium]|nr:hypothetical protein [Gammaproteobacteria bacterium]
MTQASLITTSAAERYSGCAKTRRSGRDLKLAGQAATLDAEADEWKQATVFLFKSYLKQFAPGDRFAMEDFRAYADSCNHPSPHTHHVWGSMPAVFIAAGARIKSTGEYHKAKSPRTHGHPVLYWEVLQPTVTETA